MDSTILHYFSFQIPFLPCFTIMSRLAPPSRTYLMTPPRDSGSGQKSQLTTPSYVPNFVLSSDQPGPSASPSIDADREPSPHLVYLNPNGTLEV